MSDVVEGRSRDKAAATSFCFGSLFRALRLLLCFNPTSPSIIVTVTHSLSPCCISSSSSTHQAIIMKFTILTLLFALLAVALAAAPQKAVMVSYPDNTPQYVLDDAKAAIKAAVGTMWLDMM